jgi:hypothetical protein
MILPFVTGQMLLATNGMETAMCTTTFGTLTLACMLTDPLIQAVMRSDRVSEDDYAALLFRVKDTLADRVVWPCTVFEPECELAEV